MSHVECPENQRGRKDARNRERLNVDLEWIWQVRAPRHEDDAEGGGGGDLGVLNVLLDAVGLGELGGGAGEEE